VKDPKFDLELLETHLHRAEVINIGIRNLVSVTKHVIATVSSHKLLAKSKQFFIRIPNITGVKDMVIVPTIVETHELHLEQRLDVFRLRVDHPYDIVLTLNFVTHNKEVRIHLHVKEHEGRFVLFCFLSFRLSNELHVADNLQTQC
jgi:hypothetical protein